MKVTHLALDRINGFERRPSGVYIPTKESLRGVLEKARIPEEEEINYISQGNERQSLEIAKKIGQSALLVGPTGVGKSMVVRSLAQEWKLPMLWFTCDPDKTETKVVGRRDVDFANVEINGKVEMVQFKHFNPSNIGIAGLCNEPIVLFIDELHKLRKDIDSLFHPLINEREVNISDHAGPGEVYPLHKDTIVIFALNPYYGDGGIERVGQAMRQRLKTIYFPMVTEDKKLMAIVEANVSGIQAHRETVEKICKLCAGIARVYLESRHEAVTEVDDHRIKNELKGTMTNITEAPSPRIIVNTTKAIVAGQDAGSAVLEGIFNAITSDFGATARALMQIAKDVYGIDKK